jgi:hypothetical protein
VAVAVHVVLREAEDLQGRDKEVLLSHDVADELVVVSGVLQEVARGLSEVKRPQQVVKDYLYLSFI